MAVATVVPGALARDADVGAVIHQAATKVLAMLDSSESTWSIDALLDLQCRWGAFIHMTKSRRERSTAIAQAVERRIEIEIGRILLGVKAASVSSMLEPNDISMFRLFARYAEVVLDVIEHSSNSVPPTRHRCSSAIRMHRYASGELKEATARPQNRPRPLRRNPPVPVSRARERPTDNALAREVGGVTSDLYGLIRRAQAIHCRIDDPAFPFAWQQIGQALIEAEMHCVALLQQERCR